MRHSGQPNRLFFKPRDYFKSLLEDINQAQTEVILESYIFRLDELGHSFVRALQQACTRGVQVRLLIDGVGSYLDTTRLVNLLESRQCEIRIFHPLPWDFKVFRNALSAGQHYSSILFYFAKINRRNHRKLCIIDGRIAWLGSFNITAEHYNQTSVKTDNDWHDTGLRTTGSAVDQLNSNFEQVWHRKGETRTQRSRQFLAIDTIRDRRQTASELVEVLQLASRRVWITNAYFNPANRLLRLLKKLARKGVSVQLIVPSRSDVAFFPTMSRTYYADLLNAGIRVFEYQKGVLHSKTMLIDDALIVGSTNLNYRSFIHDLELDALVTDIELISQMQKRFEGDIVSCTEITLRHWQEYPLLLKLLGWLPRLMRYWL